MTAATVNRPRYLAHRAYYAATYAVGLRALRLAVRMLPLHRAADLADRLAAAERRALDPDRYGVTYAYRRTRYVGPDGWPFTGCAVGVDRYDVTSDAAAVAAVELRRRARVALARADRAIAVADGRRWWREVGR